MALCPDPPPHPQKKKKKTSYSRHHSLNRHPNQDRMRHEGLLRLHLPLSPLPRLCLCSQGSPLVRDHSNLRNLVSQYDRVDLGIFVRRSSGRGGCSGHDGSGPCSMYFLISLRVTWYILVSRTMGGIQGRGRGRERGGHYFARSSLGMACIDEIAYRL